MSQEMLFIHIPILLYSQVTGASVLSAKPVPQVKEPLILTLVCRLSVCPSLYQLRVSYYTQISSNFLWNKKKKRQLCSEVCTSGVPVLCF